MTGNDKSRDRGPGARPSPSSTNLRSCASWIASRQSRRRLRFDHSRECPLACAHARGTAPAILPRDDRRRPKGALCLVTQGRTTCGRTAPRAAPAQGRSARRRLLRAAPAHRERGLLRREVSATEPRGFTFRRWIAFHEPVLPGLRLIPDGYAEWQTPTGVRGAFLEVDLGHEGLKVWKEKVRNYLQLAALGEFERRFSQSRFRVLVVAPSERRLRSIRSTVVAATQKVFWFASLEAIRAHGFFASVWVRPTGDERRPLL